MLDYNNVFLFQDTKSMTMEKRMIFFLSCIIEMQRKQLFLKWADPWRPIHFLERVFWFFFDSICRRGLENTFDEKKLRAFLSKFARSRSFFRNVFGIARNTQKISGKSGDISKKIGPLYWNYRFLSHFLNKQQLEYTTVTELSFDTGNFVLWK